MVYEKPLDRDSLQFSGTEPLGCEIAFPTMATNFASRVIKAMTTEIPAAAPSTGDRIDHTSWAISQFRRRRPVLKVKEVISFLPQFIISFLICLAPLWIQSIAFKTWRPLTKKIVIAWSVSLYLAFLIYAINGLLALQTTSIPSIWLPGLVFVSYFLIVLVSAYFSWPRWSSRIPPQFSHSARR